MSCTVRWYGLSRASRFRGAGGGVLATLGALAVMTSSAAATPAAGGSRLASEGLARDAATILKIVTAKHEPRTWPVRVTILGWTADHGAVYRTLVCDPDELGGRGSWCDLDTCIARPSAGTRAPEPVCETDATFSLSAPGATPTARAIIRTGLANAATFGVIARGTKLPPLAVTLTVADQSLSLVVPAFGTAPVLLSAATVDDDSGTEKHGVDRVITAQASQSPDLACIVSVGMASYFGRYESVAGYYPVPFAAVVCRAGT